MTFSIIKSSMICYRVSYTYDCRISKTKDSRIKGLSMHGKLTMLKTNHLNSSIQQIPFILYFPKPNKLVGIYGLEATRAKNSRQ